jgi:hypothetical protein
MLSEAEARGRQSGYTRTRNKTGTISIYSSGFGIREIMLRRSSPCMLSEAEARGRQRGYTQIAADMDLVLISTT